MRRLTGAAVGVRAGCGVGVGAGEVQPATAHSRASTDTMARRQRSVMIPLLRPRTDAGPNPSGALSVIALVAPAGL
jgi:hypothetical protein